MKPTVSVIMPVYNAGGYLRGAVESILSQTFSDFEFIVIDDGSTDDSHLILTEYARKDARLRIHRQPGNLGIVAALNQGLALARGKYIARMDSDDYSCPKRLETQMDFLENHPEVGIVGCFLRLVDETGKKLGTLVYPQTDLDIRWHSLFSSPFAHPAVMLRSSVLIENGLKYNPEMDKVEDFDLWARLLEYTAGANLPAPLLRYRVHTGSIVSNHSDREFQKIQKIIYSGITKKLPGVNISTEQVERIALNQRGALSHTNRADIATLYLQLWDEFSKSYSPDREFIKVQRKLFITVGKWSFYPLLQPGWNKILLKMLLRDPWWPIYGMFDIPSIVRAKILGLAIERAKTKKAIRQ